MGLRLPQQATNNNTPDPLVTGIASLDCKRRLTADWGELSGDEMMTTRSCLSICEGILMFPDTREYIAEKYPGLISQMEDAVNEEKGRTCPYCRGTGANPMSDNVNWLPCSSCSGTGKRKQ